jgi:hypothetical protein
MRACVGLWLCSQALAPGFSFFNFVREVDWRSSTRGLSQIWLEVREKSRNVFKPCYVVTTGKNQSFKYGELNFFSRLVPQVAKFRHKKKIPPLGPEKF